MAVVCSRVKIKTNPYRVIVVRTYVLYSVSTINGDTVFGSGRRTTLARPFCFKPCYWNYKTIRIHRSRQRHDAVAVSTARSRRLQGHTPINPRQRTRDIRKTNLLPRLTESGDRGKYVSQNENSLLVRTAVSYKTHRRYPSSIPLTNPFYISCYHR